MLGKRIFDLSPIKKKFACPNYAVGHPIGFFDPPKCPLGVIFGPPKILQYYSWIARIPKPNVEKKIFEKNFLTHPTKPLAAILYFGELGEKLNAQRKKIFGASKLGQKTTFKRYPFLKSSEKILYVPHYSLLVSNCIAMKSAHFPGFSDSLDSSCPLYGSSFLQKYMWY